ncbi:MAG: hypothetical protein KJ880_06725 [Candidatus Omnitrophica bacterium]|nr:hypothetical protein [Candidatus Omnitrophota bacterium]
MKKLLFILSIVIFLQIGIAYSAELTCEINNGTIGGLQMGSSCDRNAIIRAIGQEPEKVEDDNLIYYYSRYYHYNDLGLFIATSVEDDVEYLHSFDVYLNKMEYNGKYHAKFKGNILPQVSSLDTVASIKEKFGAPNEEELPTGAVKSTLLHYKKSYGWAIFWFDESGKLDYVSISVVDQ